MLCDDKKHRVPGRGRLCVIAKRIFLAMLSFVIRYSQQQTKTLEGNWI
jgi:hypothetical protein